MGQTGDSSGTDVLIGELQRRARLRSIQSYAILGLMLALVGVGAWVFVNAKEITTSETKADAQSLVSTLQTRQQVATQAISESTKDLLPLLRSLGEVRQSVLQSNSAKFHINLTSESGAQRPLSEILAELQNDLKRTGYNFIDYEVRIKTSALPGIRVRVTSASPPTAEQEAAYPKLDLAALLERVAPAVREYQLANDAIGRVTSKERSLEIDSLLGRSAEASNVNLSVPFLVQLNVTRFGTITLVVIAISILSPLYRFSARLAAFYQARADALHLHKTAYREVGIVQLIDAFSPQIDFASVQAPQDRITELIKTIASDSKQER